MKKNYSPFRKLFAFALLATFLIVGTVAVSYEVKAAQTDDVALVSEFENEAARYEVVLVCAFLIPAVHSLRVTGSMGFMRQKVYVPELNLYMSHSEKHLYDFITQGGANAQTVDEFRQGKLKFEPFADSIKAIITGLSGNQEIFNPGSAIQRQGRIPELFNQAEFAVGTNVAIEFVGLAYATDATVTVPEGDVDYTRVVTAWPAAMANGELIFLQNDAIKCRFMAKAAGSQANAFLSGVQSDGIELSPCLLLEEKKQIKLEFRFASGQAISGTNNHFIDVTMMGSILRRRS
jgi:hypothetical protein